MLQLANGTPPVDSPPVLPSIHDHNPTKGSVTVNANYNKAPSVTQSSSANNNLPTLAEHNNHHNSMALKHCSVGVNSISNRSLMADQHQQPFVVSDNTANSASSINDQHHGLSVPLSDFVDSLNIIDQPVAEDFPSSQLALSGSKVTAQPQQQQQHVIDRSGDSNIRDVRL